MMVAGVVIIATLTGAAPAAASSGPDKPAAAQNMTPKPNPAGDVTLLYASGFYIWDAAYRGAGRWCYWGKGGNDAWYGDTGASGGGTCNDMATSLLNNAQGGGYDDVFVYKHINYGQPEIVICNGDYLQDMSRDVWSDGSNANNSASSHAWWIYIGRC
jgi:hypothetical protein